MEQEQVLGVEEVTFDDVDVSQDIEKKMQIEAIARLVVNIVLLVNWILTISGKNPIPFSEDMLYA